VALRSGEGDFLQLPCLNEAHQGPLKLFYTAVRTDVYCVSTACSCQNPATAECMLTKGAADQQGKRG
jgi:hypothetical protein